MILETILFIIITFLLILFILNVSINSVFGPFLFRAKDSLQNVKVSVLVPARNEEKNIARCVKSIMRQDYPDFELIVLNDNSTDNTAEILNELQKEQNFRVINGKPLPEGWLGKNFACKQLSESAKGDVLIFTDADNWHSEDAIFNTVNIMDKYNLSFLSAFPQQTTKSFSEKLIVPVIDIILYSLLVLWLNYYFKNPAFAAANGQWIALRKDDYDAFGGHSAVKNKVVEDVSLCREFKKRGKRVMTLAGKDMIFGRMYFSFSEIWEGLSKNIFGLTDFRIIPFFFILTIFVLTAIFPYVYLFFNTIPALILIALNLIWRGILSIRYGHNAIISLFLHPVSVLFLVLIGINSVIKYYRGGLKWKGRKISLE